MIRGQIARVITLIVGDTIALYAALLLALVIRYGSHLSGEHLDAHLIPFTLIFALWLLVFYIAGIYDLRRLRNGTEFWKTLTLAMGVNTLLTIAFFYLIPFFGITPRTNLFLFIIIFSIIELFWRRSFNGVAARGAAPYKVLFVANGEHSRMLAETIEENPQLGYELIALIEPQDAASLRERVAASHINLIVVPVHMRNHEAYGKILYDAMNTGIHVMDVPRFAELVWGKIPLVELDESWLVGHELGEPKFYDNLKRGFELIFALALGIALLPLELLIALIIAFTSRGPIVYSQTRVGKHGREFTLYKFRSMKALAADGSAETGGAAWAERNDRRVTWFGKFLRASHLDELPQIWNIIRGDLSFVGPRPERPEFVGVLREKVPFYDVRDLVQPGVTGWAQINYRYGGTVDDAARKLEYDMYYIKNRSLILDIAIILKTLKSFFVNQK